MKDLLSAILSDYKINEGIEKCVVLDIDLALVHTLGEELSEISRDLLEKSRHDTSEIYYNISVKGKEYLGIKRPGLDLFLEFCDNNFQVIVWSAGTYEYVHAVVDEIFQNHKRPHMIYTRDDCEMDEEGFLIKPLSKIYSDKRNIANEYNTLVIDDTPKTYSLNQFNALRISRFRIKSKNGVLTINELLKNDNDFRKILWYFLSDSFIYCHDIRGLEKPVLV